MIETRTKSGLSIEYVVDAELVKMQLDPDTCDYKAIETTFVSMETNTACTCVYNNPKDVTFNFNKDKYDDNVISFFKKSKEDDYYPKVNLYIDCYYGDENDVENDFEGFRLTLASDYCIDEDYLDENIRHLGNIYNYAETQARLLSKYCPELYKISTHGNQECYLETLLENEDGNEYVECVVVSGGFSQFAQLICKVPLEQAIEECKISEENLIILDRMNREYNVADIERALKMSVSELYNDKFSFTIMDNAYMPSQNKMQIERG